MSFKVFKRGYLLNHLFSEEKTGFTSHCPAGLFHFPPFLERLIHPLLFCAGLWEHRFLLVLSCLWKTFCFPKNENLIWSLEHVGESRSQEISQELGKTQETCGRMGLQLGRGLSWNVQAVWSQQAQHKLLGSHLLLLFSFPFNLLHCPRLGFLGDRLRLRLVWKRCARECSWDQHWRKGRKRRGGERREEEGRKGSRIGSRDTSGWDAVSVEASADLQRVVKMRE